MSFQGETGLPGPQGPPGISGTLVGLTLAHGEMRNYCLKKSLKNILPLSYNLLSFTGLHSLIVRLLAWWFRKEKSWHHRCDTCLFAPCPGNIVHKSEMTRTTMHREFGPNWWSTGKKKPSSINNGGKTFGHIVSCPRVSLYVQPTLLSVVHI